VEAAFYMFEKVSCRGQQTFSSLRWHRTVGREVSQAYDDVLLWAGKFLKYAVI